MHSEFQRQKIYTSAAKMLLMPLLYDFYKNIQAVRFPFSIRGNRLAIMTIVLPYGLLTLREHVYN